MNGIRYVSDFIDQDTEERLIVSVDEHLWQQSVDHRVQVHGYHYSHRERAAYRIGDLPLWARVLASRLHDEGYTPSIANQLVANEYPPGTGIFAHIDQEVFGEVVVSVSLGSSCVMRFSDTDSANIEELFLEPRSLLVLGGSARWRWKHEIPARMSDVLHGIEHPRTRRLSLTFRCVP
jgi:alkylated DNA repair dioxygenase AlkB